MRCSFHNAGLSNVHVSLPYVVCHFTITLMGGNRTLSFRSVSLPLFLSAYVVFDFLHVDRVRAKSQKPNFEAGLSEHYRATVICREVRLKEKKTHPRRIWAQSLSLMFPF
jgi:hypothetical protein